MDNQPKTNQYNITLIFVGALIVSMIIGVGFWYLQNKKSSGVLLDEETISSGFGAQILEKSQNPIKDKLPETNPFQKDANPLKDVYINPF